MCRSFLPRLQHNLAQINPAHSTLPTPFASVAAIFRWQQKEKRSLEILFIRRSINKRDPWSGQIAFPGGRREKKTSLDNVWETSLETAQRETMEEIGLDLTQPHIHHIGSLPQIQTHRRTYWVGTEVFYMDKSAEEQEFVPVISQKEVSDVFWCDVQELYNNSRYQRLIWPIEAILPITHKHPWIKFLIQQSLGNLSFRAIRLPSLSPSTNEEWILWGLTLRMVATLCEYAEAPLQLTQDSVQFESKRLGDLFLFIYQHPHQALKRSVLIAASAYTAASFISRL